MQTLGEFEQLVLTAVMLLADSEAYGMRVHEEVEKLVGRWRIVSLGSIYTTLDRLEDKGMVSSTYGEPTAERGGRAKRFFKIEAAGQRALERSLRTAAAMSGALRKAGGLA